MSNKPSNDIPLGRNVPFPDSYDKTLLSRLTRPRDPRFARSRHFATAQGFDRWTSYELTWLDDYGNPQIAILQFDVPHHSSFIVESKSVKLYLGSLTFERFAHRNALINRIQCDLEEQLECEIAIGVLPFSRDDVHDGPHLDGTREINDFANADSGFEPDVGFPVVSEDGLPVEETLRSDLLRTICPVTGQPDYATLYVQYSGKPIAHESLTKYIAGFRRHRAFHEPTVERFFVDLLETCQSEDLAVLACFARRGGIDIAPLRTTDEHPWLSSLSSDSTA